MALSPLLLELLVCPESHAPLLYFGADQGGEEFLFCPESKLKYRIEDGIPVMLIEEAERVDDQTCAQLVARAGR